MLRIDIPVSKANTLLGANFTEFKDKTNGETLVRTLSISLPDDVEPHLKFIYPTMQYASLMILVWIQLIHRHQVHFLHNAREPELPGRLTAGSGLQATDSASRLLC